MAAQVITETTLAHVGDRATTVNLGERLIGRPCAATVVGDRKRARSQDDVARHDAASKCARLEEQRVRHMIRRSLSCISLAWICAFSSSCAKVQHGALNRQQLELGCSAAIGGKAAGFTAGSKYTMAGYDDRKRVVA